MNAAQWPFLHFALVRFQQHTAPLQPGELPPHASTVVLTDFVQLLPQRFLTATRLAPDRVHLVMSSFASNHTAQHDIRVRWQQRRFGPKTPDICIDAPGPAGLAILKKRPDDFSKFAGEVATDTNFRPLAVWNAGRIVVEERQSGLSVELPTSTTRVIYRELFDFSVFDRADGPL